MTTSVADRLAALEVKVGFAGAEDTAAQVAARRVEQRANATAMVVNSLRNALATYRCRIGEAKMILSGVLASVPEARKTLDGIPPDVRITAWRDAAQAELADTEQRITKTLKTLTLDANSD